ncbi:transcriptional regulator [Alkalimonas sp.]|uniref:transcriptional regulator n=1 Tax=Alkalimonas sp. TaxID=1872453 RepID=UPI00263B8BB3|nr:transcriptional regulator [Alkalimonas sp.]MCC5826225.1 helix-turn-helix transcriptional regulator [Alkalimonas sp.]
MQVAVKDSKQLGQLVRLVRKAQRLDQVAAASLSANGTTFLSDFENGKATVELGRVLRVLDMLGIRIHIDLPIERVHLTKTQQQQLATLLQDAGA